MSYLLVYIKVSVPLYRKLKGEEATGRFSYTSRHSPQEVCGLPLMWAHFSESSPILGSGTNGDNRSPPISGRLAEMKDELGQNVHRQHDLSVAEMATGVDWSTPVRFSSRNFSYNAKGTGPMVGKSWRCEYETSASMIPSLPPIQNRTLEKGSSRKTTLFSKENASLWA